MNDPRPPALILDADGGSIVFEGNSRPMTALNQNTLTKPPVRPPDDRFNANSGKGGFVARDGSLYPVTSHTNWNMDAWYGLHFAPSSWLLKRALDCRKSAGTDDYPKPESPAVDVGSRDFLSAGSSKTALDPDADLTAAVDNAALEPDDDLGSVDDRDNKIYNNDQ
jgi:hypothetical protein